jgi:radical SAM superfamily enzyme YgiQ (UPF0313 family)
MTKIKESRWNKYKVWKPLGLLVLAGMTPSDWEITVLDENIHRPDYSVLEKPDLVGITAFTSQANRAYEISSFFRSQDVPVVLGGIHATMCYDEASQYADSVLTGEAESIWPQVLEDVRKKALKPLYRGEHLDMNQVPLARHDLLPGGYFMGSIQVSRGCPLNCKFCSVTAFNGGKYRVRPINKVLEELKIIKEKNILFVDDNLIGTKKEHMEQAKHLFQAMINEKIDKRWCSQVTINMAEDEELLELAAKSGCTVVYIGFESPCSEGLQELNKSFNLTRADDFRHAVRRMQRHGILVIGSFMMGLDIDRKGIGRQMAEACSRYGLDFLNLTYMTPLPGTRLWDEMKKAGRIRADSFPEDWKYYNMIFPVAQYKHLSWEDMIRENFEGNSFFYSYPRIIKRVFKNLFLCRRPLLALGGNLSYRNNAVRNFFGKFSDFDLSRGQPLVC